MASVSTGSLASIGAVQDILDTELDEAFLAAFINIAHTIVADRLYDKGLSGPILTQIEIWLAAHLATARDPQAESENIAGEYQVKYQGKYDLGLNGSKYGQTVLLLDSSGTLATAGSKRAGMLVFATPEPYTSRL